jgi:hypothetical protein
MRAVLLALVLLQQTAAAPASVEGVVIDSSTGRPLSGATVTLRDRTAAHAVMQTDTRADGTFFFPSVPPASYTFEASHAGYLGNSYGDAAELFPGFRAPSFQEVTAGQRRAGVRIALTPGGVLHGRVMDDRGDVVVGATVQAFRTQFRNGLRDRVVVQRATTDDLGEYRLFMLPAGEYAVAVIDPALSGPSLRPDGVPLFFPGTLDPTEAQPLLLQPGEIRGAIDFAALPTKARRVTGSVQGLPPGDAASIFLTPRNGTASSFDTSKPDGTFEFNNVMPGSYVLVAQTVNSRSMVPLEVRNADVLNVRLTLGSAFRVPVRVRIEGHPDGNDPDIGNLYFLVRRDPPIAGLDSDTYSPFENGRFSVEVLGGNYRLDLTRTEDFYVKAMTLDGVDVLNSGLRVESSSDSALEILVGTNPGSVEGRVQGQGVTVVLVPEIARRGQRPLYQSRQVGNAGSFRFDKVPPGDYKLFAFTEENGGPWLDPEYLRRFEDRGVPIRVEPAKATALNQPLIAN